MSWYDVVLRWIGLNPNIIINGVPNLTQIAPRLWRMGQPEDIGSWADLFNRIGADPRDVVVVKLNADAEGDDDKPSQLLDFGLVKRPMPPYDTQPWTALVRPDPAYVHETVDVIERAYKSGKTVIIHCTAGRERTGLVTALSGIQLFGWTKEYAELDMIHHGFRWPGAIGLDVYLLTAP